MGCDIHWIIERKHKDGKWEAVSSDTSEWMRQFSKNGYETDFDDPATAFSLRSYLFFGALSGVRCNEAGKIIGTLGMPEDLSDYSNTGLEWSAPIDLHSHSWCTLGRLRDAASGAYKTEFLEGAEALEAVTIRLQQLEDFLVRDAAEGPTSILFGRRYDNEADQYHPDMSTMSNHEKMQLVERGKYFEPMSGETVRLLFAYDN